MCVSHPPVPHTPGPTTCTITSGVPSPFRSNDLEKYRTSPSPAEYIFRSWLSRVESSVAWAETSRHRKDKTIVNTVSLRIIGCASPHIVILRLCLREFTSTIANDLPNPGVLRVTGTPHQDQPHTWRRCKRRYYHADHFRPLFSSYSQLYRVSISMDVFRSLCDSRQRLQLCISHHTKCPNSYLA